VSFTAAIFLFGAAGVLGPVLAHLLARPRFRRLPFTMLQFLREGQVESQSRRRLRDLLILLLRCAVIVLIALLFARPRLPAEAETGTAKRVHYLALDNSASMAYRDGGHTYFDTLQESALDYVGAAQPGEEFCILGLASGDRAEGLDKRSALAYVERLKLVHGSADFKDFVSELRSGRRGGQEGNEVACLVVSDFTPSTLERLRELEQSVAVDHVSHRAITSSAPLSNAAITDANLVGIADGKLVLSVTVANCGEVQQSRRLTARLDGRQSQPVEALLAPGERRTYSVQMDIPDSTGGDLPVPVTLALSPADRLAEDDAFYLAVSVPEHRTTNVLLVGQEREDTFLLETALGALHRPDSRQVLSTRRIECRELQGDALRWADVAIFAALPDRLAGMAPELRSYLLAGGKAIFFLCEKPSRSALERLWAEGVLAARPGRFVAGPSRMERRASHESSMGDLLGVSAVESLNTYRLDELLLKGHFECRQDADSVCLWHLRNGGGFLYIKRLGGGATVLVNTSADDSLGELMKSRATAAFCRYLLGRARRIAAHSFRCGETAVLPATDMEVESAMELGQFWAKLPDGEKAAVRLTGSVLVVPPVLAAGWVRTLARPVRQAAMNLPEGETNVARPTEGAAASAISRLLHVETDEAATTGEAARQKRGHLPLWRWFAVAAIALLLLEAAMANRLRR